MEDNENMVAVRKQMICNLISERILAYQKILVFNRRKSRSRIRRRLMLLRGQYVHKLLDMQKQFLLQVPRPVLKTIWKEERSSLWWEQEVTKFNESQWIEQFRISRKSFRWLCSQLQKELNPKVTVMRKPISLEKRLAMALYKLATGSDYRTVSELFGVARSTVCKFVILVCRAITGKLKSSCIFMPDEHDLEQITAQFANISNLPLIGGAIGRTNIPIAQGSDNKFEYMNIPMRPSMVLHAVVDNQLMFRNVEVNSSNFLNQVAEELTQIDQKVDGCNVGSYLVGSNTYPLLPWLVTKYYEPNKSEEIQFNACLEKARCFVEKAIFKLNARWGILNMKTDIEHRNMHLVTETCCVLHNIAEINKDGIHESWLEKDKIKLNEPELEDVFQASTSEMKEGKKLRTYLTMHLNSKNNINYE